MANEIDNWKNLGCAIALQAAKDYEAIDGVESSPAQRGWIIRQLRSDYMNLITDGKSSLLADELKRDYKAVVKRIKNMEAVK